MREKCYQRERREAEAVRDPHVQDTTLDYEIGTIDAKEANAFIKRYEWLGTPGTPRARYCARNAAGEVVAVALFGRPTVQSSAICREIDIKKLKKPKPGKPDPHKDYREAANAYLATVICLERGACAHFAHPHTASWFLSRVLQRAHDEHGWSTVYAYSDMEAGEIGTVYQACGWRNIGQGVGRNRTAGIARPRDYFRHRDWPEGKWVSSRAFDRRRLKVNEHVGRKCGEDFNGGLSDIRQWEWKETTAKLKYIQFVGDRSERRDLIKALRYPPLPYPKRPSPGRP
jgi:hypothetical protein